MVAIDVGGNSVDLAIMRHGKAEQIRTNWLIGCDGAHSVVRAAAGVAFDGGAYEESFVLADVQMEWPLSREEVSLFFSPAGLVVVAPLPDERYRIVATIDTAPEHPDIVFLQRILDSRGPQSAGSTIQEIAWSSRFHLQHRVTATPRVGQVLLCGDAAHVHSPAGGQGMSLASRMLYHSFHLCSKLSGAAPPRRWMHGRPAAMRSR
ncbi:FAD-dependent monooxygenase [Mesorhizobium sp. ES1-4]|uniref:FAD-dependent monooxygenase n=1 Tax=Mesorhizobium sp. ES1-4 TaxID=2876627 RepID=UPI001CCDD746|nr:NAD(P)/FAD-dependent oxidoreductase [Mesorhizobium sp. ES1-4]MBZ9798335.1 FAD-dependent monooxygenase [Mesorhizobium sp. ES1-4]